MLPGGQDMKLELPDWRMLARFGLLLVAAQVGFWVVLTVAERAARPPGMHARPYVEFTVVDEAGRQLAGGERFRAPYQPDPNYKTSIREGSARGIFHIPFEVDDPSEELALYLAVSRSIQEIRVNDVIVQPNVPLDSFSGGAGWEPVFYVLPVATIRKGANEITALVENEGFNHVFPEFAVGPAEQLATAYRWGNVFNIDLPLAGIAILAFTALLCLVVNWPREDRPRMRALVAMLVLLALKSYWLSFYPPIPISRLVNFMIYWTLTFGVIFAAVWFVMRDVGAPRASYRWLWMGWGAIQVLCIVMPLTQGMFGTGPRDWFKVMEGIELFAAVVLVSGAMLALAVAASRKGAERWTERGILIICLMAILVDTADSNLKLMSPLDAALPLTFYAAPLFGLLLGLSMVLSLASQASAARNTVANANEILASRLATREAELRESYGRERDAQKRAVLLEERQRIVRDMHDGIGGQLLGLAVQAKARQLDADGLDLALQTSIADLRLIVDSLDSAEEGLSDALRGFEHRVRAQATAIRAELVSRIDLDQHDTVLGPRGTLQVLRILQEAVANAIRHGAPSRLDLAAGLNAEGRIEIVMQDNGPGFGAKVSEGRGLANMRSRAASIGATLDIASTPAGTRVKIVLPPLASDAVEREVA